VFIDRNTNHVWYAVCNAILSLDIGSPGSSIQKPYLNSWRIRSSSRTAWSILLWNARTWASGDVDDDAWDNVDEKTARKLLRNLKKAKPRKSPEMDIEPPDEV
jgi:hypothetical protein